MNGKDKCKILKDIRKKIAEANDIEWIVSECSHKGQCKGTCPKCESEVRKLERELSLRRKLGRAVAITGVSAACMAGLAACSPMDVIETGVEFIDYINQDIRYRTKKDDPEIILDGDVEYFPDDVVGEIAEDWCETEEDMNEQ